MLRITRECTKEDPAKVKMDSRMELLMEPNGILLLVSQLHWGAKWSIMMNFDLTFFIFFTHNLNECWLFLLFRKRTGGMQDFNYVSHGCMEITLEISCCKFPPASDLPRYWQENRDVSWTKKLKIFPVSSQHADGDDGEWWSWWFIGSMSYFPQSLLKFLGEAHRGVRGFVLDPHGEPVQGAFMKIKERDVGFRTTKHGEFWRILLPGRYMMQVSTWEANLNFFLPIRLIILPFKCSSSKLFCKLIHQAAPVSSHKI